jgi:hypothetical protein
MADVWTQLTAEFGDPLEFDSTADIETAVEILMGKQAATEAKEQMEAGGTESSGAEPPDPAAEIELQAKGWSGIISAAIKRLITLHKDNMH